jgi:hypothetical protein
MINTSSLAALALFPAMAAETGQTGLTPLPGTEQQPQSELKESPPKPVEGQIVVQEEGTLLMSEIIGAAVYAPNDESIGDVNDAVVGKDGAVEGIVVGVGGVMGLGERDIAVKFGEFALTPSPDGSRPRVVLNASAADLGAAAPFKSVPIQRMEEREAAMDAQQGGELPPPPTTSQ